MEELLEKERLERRALANKLIDMERDQFKDEQDPALEKSRELSIINEVDSEPNKAMRQEIDVTAAEDGAGITDEIELIEETGVQEVDEDLANAGLCEPHLAAEEVAVDEVEPKKKPMAPETDNEIPVVELYKGVHTVQVDDVDISDDVEPNEKLAAADVVLTAEDVEDQATTEQGSPSRLSLRAGRNRSASELSSGSEPAESLDDEYRNRVRRFWLLRHELQRQVLEKDIEVGNCVYSM